jgi:hypothetical protein
VGFIVASTLLGNRVTATRNPLRGHMLGMRICILVSTFFVVQIVKINAQEVPPLPSSVDARVPANSPLVTDTRNLHRYWWTSQFQYGMRNNPDSFRDTVFIGYYGAPAKSEADMRVINDKIMAYGKLLPGYGTGFGFVEQFAKDARTWPDGIEGRKAEVTKILNRCPSCFEEFANEAYDVLLKGRAGLQLTNDEKAFYTQLSQMVDEGKFLDVDASFKALEQRANPIDVVDWRSDRETTILNAMANLSADDFIRLMSSSQKTRTLLQQVAGNLNEFKNESSVALGETKYTLAELYSLTLSEKDRMDRQQKLDREFAEADATVALIGLVLRIVSPAEAPQFTKIASASSQIYKTLAAFDPKNTSTIVLMGGLSTGILAFIDAVSDVGRNAETEYIMSALEAIQQELHALQLSVIQLDVRVQTLLTAVARLEQNSTLQYSSLRNAMWDLSSSLSDSEVKAWNKEREDISVQLTNNLSACRSRIPVGWRYLSGDVLLREFYKQTCLRPILAVATLDARRPSLAAIGESEMLRDDEVEKFDLLMRSAAPAEMWIPQLRRELPTSLDIHRPDGTTVWATGDAPDDSLPRLDVDVWYQAVITYVELRNMVPDFLPDANQDAELIRLDKDMRGVGSALNDALKRRLNELRFAAAIDSYQQSAKSLLDALTKLADNFLQTKGDVWCSAEAVHAIRQRNDQPTADWLENSCIESRGELRAVSRATIAAPDQWPLYHGGGGLLAPDLLLLRAEVGIALDHIASVETSTDGLPKSDGAVKLAASQREPIQLGKPGWVSPDEEALSEGVRFLEQALHASYVVRQDTVPYSLNVSLPEILSQDLLKCIFPIISHAYSKDSSEYQEARRCGLTALPGCLQVSETSQLMDFQYKTCDLPGSMLPESDKPYDVIGFITTVRGERVADHMQAAIGLRNHGSSDIEGVGSYCSVRPVNARLNCLRGDPPKQDWRQDYQTTIVGLKEDGALSKDASFSNSHQLKTGRVQVRESMHLAGLGWAAYQTEPLLSSTRRDFAVFLGNHEANLRPYYQALNQAYVKLLSVVILHLQESAPQSEGVRSLIASPISGREISHSVSNGLLPEKLLTRLLLADDHWVLPFPNLSRVAFRFSRVPLEHLSCTPLRDDFYSVNNKQLIEAVEPREPGPDEQPLLNDDLYCRAWDELLKPQQEQIKATGHAVFPRGSRILEDGLAYLAGQSNEESLRRLRDEVTQGH